MSEEQIKNEAIAFAKTNKNCIAREITDITKYPPTDAPSSFFMAGSPGAGKTEHSINLINILTHGRNDMLRIDADELRVLIPGYNGHNSSVVHGAVSLIVEKIHDYALSNNQSFVLDGTFSRYEKAVDNINRSLQKNRFVQILYIYQNPLHAWNFTQKREQKEGRHISKEIFINQFIQSGEVVQRVRDTFDEKVFVSIIKKDFITSKTDEEIIIVPGDKLENYLKLRYTRDELEALIYDKTHKKTV